MLEQSYRSNFDVIRPSSYLFYDDQLKSEVKLDSEYEPFILQRNTQNLVSKSISAFILYFSFFRLFFIRQKAVQSCARNRDMDHMLIFTKWFWLRNI